MNSDAGAARGFHIDRELWEQLSPLLDECLDLTPDTRDGWIDNLGPQCAHFIPPLRHLLERQAEPDPFLDALPFFPDQPAEILPPFFAGMQIGPYQLIRQLGIGGMGEVWLADRADGTVKRSLALKLPIGSLHHRSLGERFVREREILARLNHPHIARLYDAGITADGHPYLALEYVEGEPLTAYCDRQRLSLEARLLLFTAVLRAVQYAHSSLVVHRDLKPSNILVTKAGEVRLLDFGIAKLLVDGEAHETELTRAGGRALTPDYASPEQITGDGITTASDVYSLGVIFYELLTGERPYKLKRGTLGGLEDAILSAEVARPSQSAKDPAAAQARASTCKRLARSLKGDLDVIACKALQKLPQERYATADAFSQDIERHLAGQPVLAQGESAWYRTRKFVLRNKTAVASVAAVAAAVGIGVGVALWQTHVALVEKRRADAEAATAQAVTDFLRNDLLAQASPNNQAKPDPNLTVRAALDRAASRIPARFGPLPLVEAAVRQTIGDTYKELGLFAEAQQQMEIALRTRRQLLGDSHKDTLLTSNNLGLLYIRQGKYAQAEPLVSHVFDLRRRTLGPDHRDTLLTMDNLAELYWHLGQYSKAEPLSVEAVAARQRTLGPDHPETLSAMNNLAVLYSAETKYPQAEPLLIKIIEAKRRVLGPEHPSTLTSVNNLPYLYVREGRFSEAEPLFVQALELDRRVLGPEHPETLTTSNNLAFVYSHNGQFALSEGLFSHILEVRLRVLGDKHPSTLTTMSALASVLRDQGEYDRAEALYTKVVETDRQTIGPDHPNTLTVINNLAMLYRDRGQYDRAEPLLTSVIGARTRVLGPEHPDTLASTSHLAELYRRRTRDPEAAELLSKVLEVRRRTLGPNHLDTADAMAALGAVLLQQQKYAEAEALLRPALQLQRSKAPNEWARYRTESLLGETLAQQGKLQEAEPLLVSAHQGLLARRRFLPFDSQSAIQQSAQWLAQLHK